MGRDSILRMDSGREFQRQGAERQNALSPIVDKRAEEQGGGRGPESSGGAGGAQRGMEKRDYGGP